MSSMKKAISLRKFATISAFNCRTQLSRRAWKMSSRRGYASGGHGAHKSGSDLPWAIGSIGLTIPVAGWLWTLGTSNSEHGHDEHGAHEAEHETKEESHDMEEEQKDNIAEDEGRKVDSSENDSEDVKEGGAENEDFKADLENTTKPTEDNPHDKSDSDSDPEDGRKETPDTSADEREPDQDDSETVKNTKGEKVEVATGAMH